MAERQQFSLTAETRSASGSAACRRLRRAGKLPAVLYGCKRTPVGLELDLEDMEKHLGHEAFYSHVLSLVVDKGEEYSVVLKDLQRHPVNLRPLHVDLQVIDQNVALTMRVPIHFLNEDRCVGVREGGGVISHILTDIDVHCLPRDLPEFIPVDVTELALGQAIHLGDLQLPEGVQLHALLHGGDPTQPVVSVHAPRVSAAAEEEAEAAQAAAAAPEEETVAAAGEEGSGSDTSA